MNDTITPQPPAPTPEPTKSPRPFYKKKRFIIPAALVALIAVAGGGGGDEVKTSQAGSTDTVPELPDPVTSPDSGVAADVKEAPKESKAARLYPGRPDAQDEDKEATMGQAVQLSGFTVTPSNPVFKQSISMFEDKGYVILDISVLNRDDKTQSYGAMDWKLQTPNGQVLDVNIVSSLEPALEMFGDLISGGKAAGKVSFEVGSQKGDFYLIYKPDAFDAGRGIWKVTL